MEIIDSPKELMPPLGGMPDTSLIRLHRPRTVAVSALDIPYIRPKLLVKEGDPVKIGTPLFTDKRDFSIQYVSPGCGSVSKIVFGERRRLKEIIISLDTIEDHIRFNTFDPGKADSENKSDIIKTLKQGGLWQCFREFPSKDTADETMDPPLIVLSLNGNDPFSPHPGIVLKNQTDLFLKGLKLLKLFSPDIVVAVKKSSLGRLESIQERITHVVSDVYPEWDPGVVLYKIKTNSDQNRSWTISLEHLLVIAEFLQTGKYPTNRVVTVTRGTDKKPHIFTRQGAPVADIIGTITPDTLITTGRFNGRMVDPDSHLGFFESTLNIISDQPEEEMFGFVRPGLFKPTASKTFLSSLIKRPVQLDCNLHGEERACINCGYCTRICPVDLSPNFVMKALLSDEIEDALRFGLLDCTRCGLCSYACPSKIELTQILSDGMDAYYKDKQ